MGKLQKVIVVMSAVFLTFTAKSEIRPEAYIAESPLLTVKINSINNVIKVLPPQLSASLTQVEAILPGMDKDKPLYLVVTNLEPVTSYAVVTLTEASKKEDILALIPEEMKQDFILNGKVALVPIQGKIPKKFAEYKKFKDNTEVEIKLDVRLIEKNHGSFIRQMVSIGMMGFQETFSGMPEEKKLFPAIAQIYTKMADIYLKNTSTISFAYSKENQHIISSNITFNNDSKMAQACSSLKGIYLPKEDSIM
ncbi:MAG: hypothetical protein NE327_20675, partial [Lentisphaeraceae bacterium]|nr:hypothetical protein [Lentisphaeraceae bacterium]